MAGCRIDAANGAHHFGSEKNVVDGNNLEEQVDSRLVIHARIKEYVAADHLIQRRALRILGKPAISAPVVGNRAAAMRNDESELRKIFKEIGGDELHESGCIGIDVMRSGCMEIRIAGRADVNHRRYIKLDHFFIERIPMLVRKRRSGPVAAGRIRIQIASDKAHLVHASLEFGNRISDRNAG